MEQGQSPATSAHPLVQRPMSGRQTSDYQSRQKDSRRRRNYLGHAGKESNGSQASHQAVAELKAEGVLPAQTLVRTSKYLNNMIEQDHRKAPQRCYPMLGFKRFGNAKVTLSGIELANKIKKGQFDTSEITGPGAMILQVWEAVLIA